MDLHTSSFYEAGKNDRITITILKTLSITYRETDRKGKSIDHIKRDRSHVKSRNGHSFPLYGKLYLHARYNHPCTVSFG